MNTAPVTALPRALCALIIAAALAPAAPCYAAETTRTPNPAIVRKRAEANREALRLQTRIDDERETLSALRERVLAMDRQLFDQRMKLSNAHADLEVARNRYRQSMIAMYKAGGLGPVELVIGSSSIRDLLHRAGLALRMARADRDTVVQARRKEAEAAYLASVMDDMERQLRDMYGQRRDHLRALERDLDAQRAILARLDPTSRRIVSSSIRRQARARSSEHRRWERASIPLRSPVWLAHAEVAPYSTDYLVPSHHPRKYRSVGSRYVAVCSWYGNQFHGRRTASGQIFNQNDFTCASRTLPFGTRLALTRGSRHIVVVVNDRGPFVGGRDLDLSRGAARALGFSGVAAVTAERVVVE